MEFVSCLYCDQSISVNNIAEHELDHLYGKITILVDDKIELVKTKKDLEKHMKKQKKLRSKSK